MRKLALAAAHLPLALIACRHSDEEDETEPTPIPNQLQQEKIAFSSRRDGDLEIFVMNPDGTRIEQVTRNASSGGSEADDEGPAWSPDGRLIAFTSTRDRKRDPLGDREIYVINVDGSTERRLTDNDLEEFGPDWLPDGRVVFPSWPTLRGGAA
jgi:Tol biopolymer transport system component